MRQIVALLALGLALGWLAGPAQAQQPEQETREFQGQALAPFKRAYDNSIKGPQKVDPAGFRLNLGGQVAQVRELTYQQVLELPRVKRVVNMPCVEGWNERLLVEGVRVSDLVALAQPDPKAKVVIFRAADGYSTALDLDYLTSSQALLAIRINGLTLDAARGFPFQLVAEKKLGYKWIKWVVAMELSDKPYLGFWETRGYSNEADTDR
jgi:DMSO/TMAO reductase YedYZ molybdopterin-dependent catalytic subunit